MDTFSKKECYQRIRFLGTATLSVPCRSSTTATNQSMSIKLNGTLWFECMCMRPKDVVNQPAGGSFKLGPNYGWLSPPGARGSPTGGYPGNSTDKNGKCQHSVKIPVEWSKFYKAQGSCPDKCAGVSQESESLGFSMPLTDRGVPGGGAGYPDSPGGGIGSDIWEYCSELLDAHEHCEEYCPTVGEFDQGELDCYLDCIEKNIDNLCPGREWLIPLLWGAEVVAAGAEYFAGLFDNRPDIVGKCGTPGSSATMSELIADLSKSYKSFSILDT